jgi:hypothetical protein
MSFLGKFRLVIFSEFLHTLFRKYTILTILLVLASIFAAVVIALASSLTSISEMDGGGYFTFAVLGIATGGLTILTLPV